MKDALRDELIKLIREQPNYSPKANEWMVDAILEKYHVIPKSSAEVVELNKDIQCQLMKKSGLGTIPRCILDKKECFYNHCKISKIITVKESN